MRQVKIARDTALQDHTAAIIMLKQFIVHAPAGLCEELEPLGDKALVDCFAGFRRTGPLESTAASVKYTLRAIARRWLMLSDEIRGHGRILDQLSMQSAPKLRAGFGIGPDSPATMLVLFGDNPDRIRSEAAFAKLCVACPVPASSGKTTGRHRLHRGGHQQANAALYRIVIVRIIPRADYRLRCTSDHRRHGQARDHSVP